MERLESYLELLDTGRLEYREVQAENLELRYHSPLVAQILYRLSFEAPFDGAPISVQSLAMTTWMLTGESWQMISITSTKV